MNRLIFKSEEKESEKKPKDIIIREEDIDMDFFGNIAQDSLRKGTFEKIAIRSGKEFTGKAIYLNNRFDYILGMDSEGITILVPLKKK